MRKATELLVEARLKKPVNPQSLPLTNCRVCICSYSTTNGSVGHCPKSIYSTNWWLLEADSPELLSKGNIYIFYGLVCKINTEEANQVSLTACNWLSCKPPRKITDWRQKPSESWLWEFAKQKQKSDLHSYYVIEKRLISPKSIDCSFILNLVILRVVKVGWGPQRGGIVMGLANQLAYHLPSMQEHSEKPGTWKPRRQKLVEANKSALWLWTCQLPRLDRNKHLVLKPLSVWCVFFMAA